MPQIIAGLPQDLRADMGISPLAENPAPDPVLAEANDSPENAPISEGQIDPPGKSTVAPTPDRESPLCHQATAGKPFDISIADGTVLSPGELFTKTWRFVNTGNCTWTPDYAIIWIYGDDLGLAHEINLRTTVEPGQTVDISVDMSAPNRPGEFHSYWKLQSAEGVIFGIGPENKSPFWTYIKVIQNRTSTPTRPPTATSTPIVHQIGKGVLVLDDRVDLDTGLIDSFDAQGQDDEEIDIAGFAEHDLVLEHTEDEILALIPLNGARLTVFGVQPPRIADCQKADFNLEPLILKEIPDDETYLCYSTNQGLPGYTLLMLIDQETETVFMEYLTWAIP
jgi:hypothetical protein